MSTIDIILAVVFSLLVFALGLSFARSGTSIKSFFAAGGSVPWWISGLSLFMSFFSVGTFVVWGSIAYTTGLVAVTIQTTMSIAGFIIGFYIAPKWNETGAITVAEFISDRLGTRVQKVLSTLFLFISLFTAGAFLYPVGKIIEVTTGIPISLCIVVLGGLIIVYTTLGGLWAVLVTDVLQFVVLSAAVLLVVPIAFDQIGGISEFLSQAPENFFVLQNAEYTWWFMLAFGFYNMVFIGGNWAYVQRYTSVATPRDAKKVGWLFGSLYLIAPLIWMLPPMIYRVMEPGLSGTESEGAYLMLAQRTMPEGLLGLMLGAMVFATASSVNTTLNISAGVFTNDIYKLIRKVKSPFETMLVARISTVVFGLMAVGVALMVQSMGGIVEVVLSLAALTGAPLYLPPIWALFSKWQTGASVLMTTVISLLINGFFKFLSPVWFDVKLSRSEEMLTGVLVPVLCLLAFEVYYRVMVKQHVQYDAYMELRAQKALAPTAPEVEGSSSANQFARKIIAIGVFLVGLIIAGLSLITDRAQILTASIGLFLVFLALPGIIRKKNQSTELLESDQDHA